MSSSHISTRQAVLPVMGACLGALLAIAAIGAVVTVLLASGLSKDLVYSAPVRWLFGGVFVAASVASWYWSLGVFSRE